MATSADLVTAFRELSNAKQLDRSELLDLLRDGIHAALMKKYGPNVRFELERRRAAGHACASSGCARWSRRSRIRAAQISTEEARFEDPDFQVGDMLEEEVPFEVFGRLAVQAAKQRIIQRVREGERTRIRDEFANKVGELLSGEIQQIERGKFVIMLNKFREAEAIVPYREQNHREHFHQGDTIRAVLKRLEETPKGPRLILSRGDPLFVIALFKLEVPEIQQGIVEMRGIAREVGSRTKVAVISRDDAIDPVGACVGLKGSRVQAVVNELGGERIDIVPWSPDPERFARLALAPARVAKVFSDPASKTIQAVVDEDQLSLAIGRNGQNVRLASELTGWKIDLYSSREWLERGGEGPLFALPPAEDEAETKVPLAQLEGLSPELVAVLDQARYTTLNDVIDLEPEEIARIPGMTPATTEELVRVPQRADRGRAGGWRRAAPAHEAMLGLIGLGVRGGLALPGVDVDVRAGCGRASVRWWSWRPMRRDGRRQKVVQPARRAGVPVDRRARMRQTLGARLGRPPVMVVGVRDRSLAAGIIAAAARATD